MHVRKRSYLVQEPHLPERAKFPVIDAHNHLWGSPDIDRTVTTMDAVGVTTYCNLTANTAIAFAGGGYTITAANIDEFFSKYASKYPGKFYCFTMAEFARPVGKPLFENAGTFASECVETLERHVALGAKGLKVLKELGLHHRDGEGKLLRIDDERFSPIWQRAGELGVPILAHQSDPYGFFQPVTEDNEHYESLQKFPSWSFSDPGYPRKEKLLEARDNVIRRNPGTTFILPHVANFAENLGYVSQLLEENSNVYIDFSARIDELGRQPYSAREFFIRMQDRIVFGTDMPADIESSIDMYRTYFRFLETFDEGFYPPDYDGTFNRTRWPICGIGLPDTVLEKIYHKNIEKIIPALRKQRGVSA